MPEQKSDQKHGYDQVKEQDISRNQSWKKEFDLLNNEIRLRQYSRKTLKSYTRWTQIFQAFSKSISADMVDSKDAKDFITHLATILNIDYLQMCTDYSRLFLFPNVMGQLLIAILKIIPNPNTGGGINF